jgi:hypothetical protein
MPTPTAAPTPIATPTIAASQPPQIEFAAAGRENGSRINATEHRTQVRKLGLFIGAPSKAEFSLLM